MKSDECDIIIRDMYENYKYPMHKIATELGMSVGKVYNRIKAMGIVTRQKKDYERSEKQIAHIRSLGKSRKGKRLSEQSKRKISEANRQNGEGHKKLRQDGYIKVYFPEHPYSSSDGYIMEHRLVMEKKIGRYLNADEVVHHINRVRADNRIENLMLMTKKEHCSLHMKERYKK